MVKVRLAVTIVLLVLVFVFALQNSATVDIKFLVFSVAIPRSLLIFLMLAIGIVIGWFTRAMYRIARSTSD